MSIAGAWVQSVATPTLGCHVMVTCEATSSVEDKTRLSEPKTRARLGKNKKETGSP